MADYQGGFSGASIDNAIGIINSMEKGTVTVTISQNTDSIRHEIRFKKQHDEIPKVFLQVEPPGFTEAVGRDVIAVMHFVSAAYCQFDLIAASTRSKDDPVYLKAGTYSINYLVI